VAREPKGQGRGAEGTEVPRRRRSRRAKRECGEGASSRMGSGSGREAKVHGEWYRIFDNLSRYFLCSNDSNGIRMGRKLIRVLGMGGNLVRASGVCVRPRLSTVGPEGSKIKESRTQDPGSKNEPGAPSASLYFPENTALIFSPRFPCPEISV